MSGVDDYVESVINEAKASKGVKKTNTTLSPDSDFRKLACQLEKAAKEVYNTNISNRYKSSKMSKLAMVTILSVIDDPKVMPEMLKMSKDIAESATDSVGELALNNSVIPSDTFVKEKLTKHKTIFSKMKENISDDK